MIIHDLMNGVELSPKRLGLPTASAANKIITSTGKSSTQLDAYALRLALDIRAGKSEGWEGNEYTEAGHDYEPTARAWYQFHSGHTVTAVGFCTDDDERYGCTPDDLVEGNGMSQYKVRLRQHLKYAAAIAKAGKSTADYAQLQFELYVAEREWTDLVNWHPTEQPFVCRHYRDKGFIESLKVQIDKTIEKRDEYLQVAEHAPKNINLAYEKAIAA